MRNVIFIALGLLLGRNVAPAQTINNDMTAAESQGPGDGRAGATRESGAAITREFTPLTTSERLRLYITGAFGPAAIARAAASGGITQWRGTPKEWGGGAEAYGERVGNSLAKHVIRKTLESGAAAAIHEDNRYIRATDAGFWKRSKHAAGSVFVARNDGGREHFAYSRFGGALGASFISRIWQPRSENSSGDAAVSFGITMATDMGWNVFREFWPDMKSHLKRK